MGKLVSGLFGGGGNASQEAAVSRALSEQQAASSRASALATALAREGEVDTEAAAGSSRRAKGRRLLTYLDDGSGSATLGG